MSCNFANEISNRNFLSPAGFQFTLAKTPKVSFFCTKRIPEINLGTAMQPSYLKDVDIPGEKLTYGDLTIRFLVDENMENYMAIHNWMTGLGFPETAKQFDDLTKDQDGVDDLQEQFSDGSLHILSSNLRTNAIVKFLDLFPVSLSSMEFDTQITDVQYFYSRGNFQVYCV